MSADVLLLTSAVRPFVVDVAHLDVASRQREVEQQILWLAALGRYPRIIVCDASGHDFSAVAAGLPSGVQLEALHFDAGRDRTADAVVYKAYGEVEIYRQVLARSKWIRSARTITKLTGRYRVASRCPLFFHDRRRFVYSYNWVGGNDQCLLTNLFRISAVEFARLADLAVRPDDPLPLEFRLRGCLQRDDYHRSIAPLPLFSGISGTAGGSLGGDPRYLAKRLLSCLLPYAYVENTR